MNLFHSGIFIFSMKNMFIDVIRIQAFELLGLFFSQRKHHRPILLVAIVRVGATLIYLSFNQAYCWLALRYTVMRYFIH